MRRCGKRYATEADAERGAQRKRDNAGDNAGDNPAQDYGVLPCRGCRGYHVHETLPHNAPAVTEGADTSSPSPRARKDTGFDRLTRALIWRRDGGRCAGCGVEITDGMWWSLQHRLPRQVGGNQASNGLVHCGSATSPGCHRKAEDRTLITRIRGYWIRANCKPVPDPDEIPVWYAHERQWFNLDNQGGRAECNPPAIDPADFDELVTAHLQESLEDGTFRLPVGAGDAL